MLRLGREVGMNKHARTSLLHYKFTAALNARHLGLSRGIAARSATRHVACRAVAHAVQTEHPKEQTHQPPKAATSASGQFTSTVRPDHSSARRGCNLYSYRFTLYPACQPPIKQKKTKAWLHALAAKPTWSAQTVSVDGAWPWETPSSTQGQADQPTPLVSPMPIVSPA